MLKFVGKILSLFIALSSSCYANSITSASSSAQSKALVLTPISLVNSDEQGLEFGSIAVGAVASVIRISPTETVSANVVSGDAVVINTVDQTAAKFTVSGDAGSSYVINIPTSMTVSRLSETMVVDNFTCSNGLGGTIGSFDVFYIGADLNIPMNATLGAYSGTFSVVVAYN